MKISSADRSYTELACEGSKARALVDLLAYDDAAEPQTYQKVMRSVGEELGTALLTKLNTTRLGDICVVCTAEDADYLARGVIERLESYPDFSKRMRLVCLWNSRRKFDGLSVSPVMKEYREDFNHSLTTFIIIKSIISGACVVKTNLTRVLSGATPSDIFVVAPVMYVDAERSLQAEFPERISKMFEFVTFAIDQGKDGENVIPGIGGSVYERLGFGSEERKNHYYPRLLKERLEREQFLA